MIETSKIVTGLNSLISANSFPLPIKRVFTETDPYPFFLAQDYAGQLDPAYQPAEGEDAEKASLWRYELDLMFIDASRNAALMEKYGIQFFNLVHQKIDQVQAEMPNELKIFYCGISQANGKYYVKGDNSLFNLTLSFFLTYQLV